MFHLLCYPRSFRRRIEGGVVILVAALLVDSGALPNRAIGTACECLHGANADRPDGISRMAVENMLGVPGPWRQSSCFYYDPKDAECFSASSDDILGPEDIAKH